MRSAGDHQTWNFAGAKFAETFDPQLGWQTLEISVFGCSQNLHPFLGEVTEETGQGQPWAIDGGLANLAMKSDTETFQLHMQLLRVRSIERLHRHHWNALPLIAC